VRCWISPDLKVLAVDDENSHAITVADDPEGFGLDCAATNEHLALVEAGDACLDYESIIVLAEMAGWVRVSQAERSGWVRTSGTVVSIGAADIETARRAIRHLERSGCVIEGVELEIARVDGGSIRSAYRYLEIEQVRQFVKHGRLSEASFGELAVEAIDLVEATLSARSPTAFA
jgi:hypothetical protein